jgi:hypothetical protein
LENNEITSVNPFSIASRTSDAGLNEQYTSEGFFKGLAINQSQIQATA